MSRRMKSNREHHMDRLLRLWADNSYAVKIGVEPSRNGREMIEFIPSDPSSAPVRMRFLGLKHKRNPAARYL